MLNESAIADALKSVIAHLEANNPEQARATLKLLDFGRLLKPIRGRAKAPQLTCAVFQFGVERVHETIRHIRACQRAIEQGRRSRALAEAQMANKRWEQNGAARHDGLSFRDER